MPAPATIGYHIVIKEYSLVVAVSRLQQSGLLLESVREFPLSSTTEIEECLKSLAPDGRSDGLTASVSVRGRGALLRLGTAPVSEWIREPECASLTPAFQASASVTGDVNGVEKKGQGATLQALLSGANLESAKALLKQWNVTPSRITVTPFATVGALVSWLQKAGGTVAMLDLGETSSFWLVADRSGLTAIRPSVLTMEALAEILRLELGLRFKGAAAKLFFNEQYDFGEVLPRIGARIAEALKPELEVLPGSSSALVFCEGLPERQAWFGGLLAESLGRKRLEVDAKALFAGAGLACGVGVPALSEVWLGALQTVRSSVAPTSIRLAEWRSMAASSSAPDQEAKPAAAAPAPSSPAPVSKSPAPAVVAPVRTVASVQAPAARPAPQEVATKPSPMTVIAGKPYVPGSKAAAAAVAEPVRAAAPSAVAIAEKPVPAPKPAAKVPALVIAPAPSLPKAEPEPARIPQPKSEPPKPPKPPEARGSSVLAYPLPGSKASSGRAPKEPRQKPPFWKTGAGMAIAAVAVVATAVILWLVTQMQSEKAAITAEKVRAQQETQAVMAKAKAAEAKAQAEAAARRQLESETSAKLASLDAARRAAEAKATREAAARLANARGGLTVATNPAGATVKVGSILSQASPARFDDLKIGTYPVVVSLPGYDEVRKEVKIQENATTDLGVIALHRQTGSVEIVSTPVGAHFELRRADSVKLGAQPRQGVTPASLSDLPTGTYSIAIDYRGVGRQTGTVAIESGGVARSSWEFALGGIEITSTPSDATVSQAGKVLGRTPLTLANLHAGTQTYDVSRAGYTTSQVNALIVKGDTRSLNVVLALSDRIYRLSELDHEPQVLRSDSLKLPSSLSTSTEYRAVIAMTVGRDGVPRDLEIVRSSDPEFGRICKAAAAGWRFKPGTVKGRPVSTRVAIPFVTNPS